MSSLNGFGDVLHGEGREDVHHGQNGEELSDLSLGNIEFSYARGQNRFHEAEQEVFESATTRGKSKPSVFHEREVAIALKAHCLHLGLMDHTKLGLGHGATHRIFGSFEVDC